jgi:hypothetical protein
MFKAVISTTHDEDGQGLAHKGLLHGSSRAIRFTAASLKHTWMKHTFYPALSSNRLEHDVEERRSLYTHHKRDIYLSPFASTAMSRAKHSWRHLLLRHIMTRRANIRHAVLLLHAFPVRVCSSEETSSVLANNQHLKRFRLVENFVFDSAASCKQAVALPGQGVLA